VGAEYPKKDAPIAGCARRFRLALGIRHDEAVDGAWVARLRVADAPGLRVLKKSELLYIYSGNLKVLEANGAAPIRRPGWKCRKGLRFDSIRMFYFSNSFGSMYCGVNRRMTHFEHCV